MKPASQISPSQRGSPRDNRAPGSHQSFPLTDDSLQAGAKSNSRTVLPATKSPAFHKMSSGFFGAETSRRYVAELFAIHSDNWNLSLADYFGFRCCDSLGQESLRARKDRFGETPKRLSESMRNAG